MYMDALPFLKASLSKESNQQKTETLAMKEHQSYHLPSGVAHFGCGSLAAAVSFTYKSTQRSASFSGGVYTADWHLSSKLPNSFADYRVYTPTHQCIRVPASPLPDRSCYINLLASGFSMILVCILLNINDAEHNSMYLTGHSRISFGEVCPIFKNRGYFPPNLEGICNLYPLVAKRKRVFSSEVSLGISTTLQAGHAQEQLENTK